MVVVTGRDFRANTAKYVDVAYRGEDVVVKSRAGSFRILPIREDETSSSTSATWQQSCAVR